MYKPQKGRYEIYFKLNIELFIFNGNNKLIYVKVKLYIRTLGPSSIY